MSKSTKFIWVCSYPKSGNTWMRHLLQEYYKRVHGMEPHDTSDRSPYWYQCVSPIPLSAITPDQTMQIRPAAMAHLTLFYSQTKPTNPVCIVKSHMLNGHTAGVANFSPMWVDYAIYITRDPRDIVPSWAHHMGESHADAVTALGSNEVALGDPSGVHRLPVIHEPVSSWSEHVRSWIENPGVATIVTSYEEMHESALSVLAAIVKQIDGSVDIQAAREAVKECEFERLKEKEARGEIADQPAHSDRPFYRKGKVQHGAELSRALRRRVEKEHEEMMTKLGYLDDED